MIGHAFTGKATEASLPEGGTLTVALGHIQRTEGAEPEQAIYTKIVDINGDIVAEYGLLSPAFGVYIETVKAVIDASLLDPA